MLDNFKIGGNKPYFCLVFMNDTVCFILSTMYSLCYREEGVVLIGRRGVTSSKIVNFILIFRKILIYF